MHSHECQKATRIHECHNRSTYTNIVHQAGGSARLPCIRLEGVTKSAITQDDEVKLRSLPCMMAAQNRRSGVNDRFTWFDEAR